MLKNYKIKIRLFSSRLIYKTEETPKTGDHLGLGGEKILTLAESAKLAKERRDQELLKAAAAEARAKAVAAGVQQGNAAAEPFQKPDLPQKHFGFEYDSQKIEKDPQSNTFKQPFSLGDKPGLTGTVTYPSKPDDKAKTTYVFNFVDDPSKLTPEAQKKFLESLEKNKAALGNAVVITMQTPAGETTINKEKVDTMTALMANLEKMQQDHPELKGKLPRPDKIMMATSAINKDKTIKLLEEYEQKVLSNKDQRVLNSIVLNNENIDQSLSLAIKQLETPVASPETPDSNSPESPATATTGAPAPRRAGGGGGGGGSASAAPSSSSTTGTSPASESPAAGPSSGSTGSPTESSAPSATPTETAQESSEILSEEAGKILMLGDSLLVGAQTYVKAKKKYSEMSDGTPTVQVGKFINGGTKSNPSMVTLMEQMDKNGQLEGPNKPDKLVIRGGGNDIANTSQKNVDQAVGKMIEGMQKIWAIAKKHGIKVICCTLAPTPESDGLLIAKKELFNKKLVELEGKENGPDKIVPLHLPLSQGGLADEKGPNDQNDENLRRRHPSVTGQQHGSHLDAKGYQIMAAQMQKIIGKPPGEISQPGTPEKVASIKVTTEDRQAAEAYLAEVHASANPESRIGETKALPGGEKILRVAWHNNHEGQWGTSSYKKIPGRHIGVQVEAAPGSKLAQSTKSSPKTPSARPENIADSTESANKFKEKEIRQKINNGKVDMLVNMPAEINPSLPTKVVIYATPNDSNPDKSKGIGDLIGAQTRMLRELPQYQGVNLIVTYITPPGNKWPGYPNQANNIYHEIQEIIDTQVKGSPISYSIDGMSGGGSYQFNLINQNNEIPDEINQFTFYDSIYSYNSIHAQKLKRWLDRDINHKLVAISGTLTSTQKQFMADLVKQGVSFTQSDENKPWITYKAMDGRISFVQMGAGMHGPTVDNQGFAYAHGLGSNGESSIPVLATLNKSKLPDQFTSRMG